MATLFGYTGRLLRVDLTTGTMWDEQPDEGLLGSAIGGVGLGTSYVYREVPPEALWSHPVNRLVFASGPLSGTRIPGSGTFCVVTKGAQTNMFASSQANGFLGAFMRFCGYDAIIVQGAAPDWLYLHLDDHGAELRDARFLLGKGAIEIEAAVLEHNPKRPYSVYGIGPAGESLVSFAMIAGDRTHVAAHNGVGAVMGSKKLKAIAIARGGQQVPVADAAGLSELRKVLLERVQTDPLASINYNLGTGGYYSMLVSSGALPVKNYTTNLFPEHEECNGPFLRANFEAKKTACWACHTACTRSMTVTTGPYKGFSGEEPEYEGMAACSSLIGNSEPGGMVWLSNLIDDLGLDVNESGWVMAFALECYEKGILTKTDTGGLELSWGNVESAGELMGRIARQQGIGTLFANGVRGAAESLGGEALNIGIYTLKGVSPRTHDHRAMWSELMEYCVSNTGTLEYHLGLTNGPSLAAGLGFAPLSDRFDWQEIARWFGSVNGWRYWFDSMGMCQTNFPNAGDQMAAYNVVTGRNLSIKDGWRIGRCMAHQMRLYNIRCGLTPAMEEPSVRYGSIPVDGPVAGRNIREHWGEWKRAYYRTMGWDEETGCPTPETLREFGLDHLVADLPAVKH